MSNNDKIASILYEEIGYMYCDNCRNSNETEDWEEKCSWCHRKYNGWGISRAEAERIAELISEV